MNKDIQEILYEIGNEMTEHLNKIDWEAGTLVGNKSTVAIITKWRNQIGVIIQLDNYEQSEKTNIQ